MHIGLKVPLAFFNSLLIVAVIVLPSGLVEVQSMGLDPGQPRFLLSTAPEQPRHPAS